MNYLFIDGSEKSTFLQAGSENDFVFSTVDTRRNLGARITAIVDDILSQAELSKNQIDIFVTCTGPGSLTGLRVAGSFLRTLAFVCNKPLIGIDLFSWSLETLKNAGVEGQIRMLAPTLIDKAFVFETNLLEVLNSIEPWLQNNRNPDKGRKNFGIRWQTPEIEPVSPAPEILHKMILARGKEAKYNFSKVLEILPMYIIPSQAERKLKDKSC
jgi:tRNA A37 threonylcarbamoyladenosine modification protein TsaB